MMEPVHRIDDSSADPVLGTVIYDRKKLVWNIGMIGSAIIFAPMTFEFSSVALFLVLTYSSLLIGHSVGMHRMMIHRTFESPSVTEKLLIYIGVLVGMSGPYGIIKIHDTRDWAQRQAQCHDFFSHRRGYFRDIWWQLTSTFSFKNPPTVNIEPKYKNDKFYQWLESTWRYHQIGVALVLYMSGGWAFVVWGVCVRVSVSVVGHWTITYFCHNPGPGTWKVKNAVVQASNLRGLGLLTYGECWHNNHHAFPESARIGVEPGQSDPAWYFIKFLAWLGLAKNIGKPRPEKLRDDLEIKNS
jgi:fatty-acid desaturase